MTLCLWLMVWFAMEKRKRANFERFWYTHHVSRRRLLLSIVALLTDLGSIWRRQLFVLFFLCWQLHGMYCEFVVTLSLLVFVIRNERPTRFHRHDQAGSHGTLQGFDVRCILGKRVMGINKRLRAHLVCTPRNARNTGCLAGSSSSPSGFCEKSERITRRSSARSSNILQTSWRYKLGKSMRRSGLGNISLSIVPRSAIGSTVSCWRKQVLVSS